MKVLHVNVRLQEGGAARIALDLHNRLLKLGIESRFAYGWGEKGGISSAEPTTTNSFQVGQQLQVALNMSIHKVFGVDIIEPTNKRKKSLLESIKWADIIHLHAIHSYFLPFKWFLNILVDSNKPIIWTAHDYWMITGRCAFIEECQNWKIGCGNCLTMNNYPSSIIDLSQAQFIKKRLLLDQLQTKIYIIAPSRFVAEIIQEALPKFNITVIPNWLDNELLNIIKNSSSKDSPRKSKSEIELIIIANDLSDKTKTNHQLINKLIQYQHIKLHTIGKNSPFNDAIVKNHGRVNDRQSLKKIISAADIALFTSKKDTFGLVMIESLACGVPVLALESSASKEILEDMKISRLNIKEILELFGDLKSIQNFINTYPIQEATEAVMNKYSLEKSACSITSLYKQVLSVKSK